MANKHLNSSKAYDKKKTILPTLDLQSYSLEVMTLNWLILVYAK